MFCILVAVIFALCTCDLCFCCRVLHFPATVLESAQAKMKSWYDKNAKNQGENPGDKVLVSIPGCSLQGRYSGPYLVKEKVGDRDYNVANPDRPRRHDLCYVDMLKSYYERESLQWGGETPEAVLLSSTETVSPCVSLVTGT